MRVPCACFSLLGLYNSHSHSCSPKDSIHAKDEQRNGLLEGDAKSPPQGQCVHIQNLYTLLSPLKYMGNVGTDVVNIVPQGFLTFLMLDGKIEVPLLTWCELHRTDSSVVRPGVSEWPIGY